MSVEVKLVDSKDAKVTLTAAGDVRVKLPQAWTPEERERTQAFFLKVVAAAPKLEYTLRGDIGIPPTEAGRKCMTLHTGTKGTIVKYKVITE